MTGHSGYPENFTYHVPERLGRGLHFDDLLDGIILYVRHPSYARQSGSWT